MGSPKVEEIMKQRYEYEVLEAFAGMGEETLRQKIARVSQEGFRVHTIDFAKGYVLMERPKAEGGIDVNE